MGRRPGAITEGKAHTIKQLNPVEDKSHGHSMQKQVDIMLFVRMGLAALLCAGKDFIDDGCFGIGVVLDVFPVVVSEFAFGAFIEETIGIVGAEPIAEEQHAVDLGAAG